VATIGEADVLVVWLTHDSGSLYLAHSEDSGEDDGLPPDPEPVDGSEEEACGCSSARISPWWAWLGVLVCWRRSRSVRPPG